MLHASDIMTSVGEHQRDYLYYGTITKDPLLKANITDYDSVKDNLDLFNTKGVFPKRANSKKELSWSGEKYYYQTGDDSTHDGTLDFINDENNKCFRFWSDFKSLGGSDEHQVGHLKANIVFDYTVYTVSVDKSTITNCVTLKNVQVLGVDELTVDKTGNDISKVRVSVCWDKAIPDYSQLGKSLG